jgi:hypothetical protein
MFMTLFLAADSDANVLTLNASEKELSPHVRSGWLIFNVL